jgi:hypothetical protein
MRAAYSSIASTLILLVVAIEAAAFEALAFEDHLFVVVTDHRSSGNCASLELLPPWSATLSREAVGQRPTARHFAGRHYVVNGSSDDAVQVIDPGTFETRIGPAPTEYCASPVLPTTWGQLKVQYR